MRSIQARNVIKSGQAWICSSCVHHSTPFRTFAESVRRRGAVLPVLDTSLGEELGKQVDNKDTPQWKKGLEKSKKKHGEPSGKEATKPSKRKTLREPKRKKAEKNDTKSKRQAKDSKTRIKKQAEDGELRLGKQAFEDSLSKQEVATFIRKVLIEEQDKKEEVATLIRRVLVEKQDEKETDHKAEQEEEERIATGQRKQDPKVDKKAMARAKEEARKQADVLAKLSLSAAELLKAAKALRLAATTGKSASEAPAEPSPSSSLSIRKVGGGKPLQNPPRLLPKMQLPKLSPRPLLALAKSGKQIPASTNSSPKNAGIEQRKSDELEGDVHTVTSDGLELTPIESDQPPTPKLAYGLDRVLFNSGVYQLQDPRTRVYNFDPYLQSIMPVAEFDFNALKEYVTSSRDGSLENIAKEQGKRYTGSTSSMTSALSHFHYLLSQWREISTDVLSVSFPAELKKFTALQRAPTAIFLKYQDGTYAIDADKEFATANILSMLGKSMEKLLTLPSDEFERYRRTNSHEISEKERQAPEAFHYSTMGDFLMRSQLDAYDPRLPGTGMFDLKTRAVLPIRMNVKDYENLRGYEISERFGEYGSFEREYYDMIRAAFLKYSLQVRMGRMDGIFVAFHNTQRIFGFQYISLEEMDQALHGQRDLALGNREFGLSITLLNKVLDKVTERFPNTHVRLHVETRETQVPLMYIFAEPVDDKRMQEIQSAGDEEVLKFEREVLGLDKTGKAILENSSIEDVEGLASKEDSTEQALQDTGETEDYGLEKDVDDLIETDEAEEEGISTEAEHDSSLENTEISTGHQESPESTSLRSEMEAELEDIAEEVELLTAAEEETNEPAEPTALINDEVRNMFTESEDIDAHETAETIAEDADQALEDGHEAVIQNSEEHTTMDDLSALGTTHESDVTEADNEKAFCDAHEELASNDVYKVDDGQSLSDGLMGQSIKDFFSSQSSEAEAKKKKPTIEKESTNGEQALHLDENGKVKPLLAMTLVIRNKVGDRYVTRPTNLKENSPSWEVDYSLGEIEKPEKAWRLYEMCKKRRAKVLISDEEKDKLPFMRSLKSMSDKHKKRRKSLDKEESGKEKIVVGTMSSPSSESV